MLELIFPNNIDIYVWIVLPTLIFFARVCDVSLGTTRIIFISKGIKYLAPLVGFFEILIWLLAISQIMQNISNIYYYFFYAGGFALGNLVGILIDEKLSIGTVSVRIITRKDAKELVGALRKKGFNATTVDAEGPKGIVKIIFIVLNRQNIRNVIKIAKKYNPNAFYSVEDIRYASEVLPYFTKPSYKNNILYFLKISRKGK
jgi:uncharacterized protein YebE (UPF0316 family)